MYHNNVRSLSLNSRTAPNITPTHIGSTAHPSHPHFTSSASFKRPVVVFAYSQHSLIASHHITSVSVSVSRQTSFVRRRVHRVNYKLNARYRNRLAWKRRGPQKNDTLNRTHTHTHKRQSNAYLPPLQSTQNLIQKSYTNLYAYCKVVYMLESVGPRSCSSSTATGCFQPLP